MNITTHPDYKSYKKDDLNTEIIKIVKEHPFSYVMIIKSKKNNHIREYIENWSKDFPDIRFQVRIYWVLNGILEYPRCENPNCPTPGGKELRHDITCNPLIGYDMHYCSYSCASSDPVLLERRRQQHYEETGYYCRQQEPDYRKWFSDKLKQLPQEHWENSTKKRKETCLNEYGVDSISKTDQYLEKCRSTWAAKSKKDLDDLDTRRKNTKEEKYGDPNYTNAEKARQTKEKNKDVNAKKEKERREKYKEEHGVECPQQLPSTKAKMSRSRMVNSRTRTYNNILLKDPYVELMFTLEEYIEDALGILKWRCKKCGNIFYAKVGEHINKKMKITRCLKCYPLLDGRSNAEVEIQRFVKSICPTAIENDRSIISPKEVDVYIHDKHFAIECDGVYWHSINLQTPPDYHLEKSQECRKKDIDLYHITDLQWFNQNDLVKKFIEDKILERESLKHECVAMPISENCSKKFITENSLEEFEEAEYHIGLFQQEQITGVISIDIVIDNIIIKNFCRKLKHECDFTDAFKYLEKRFQLKKIVAFLDRRYHIQKELEIYGFKFLFNSVPHQLVWNKREDSKNLERIELTKLASYDNDANFKSKIFRIFDSGDLVMIKENQ